MQINLELEAAEVSDLRQLVGRLANEIAGNSKRDFRGIPVFSHAVRDAERQLALVEKILASAK